MLAVGPAHAATFIVNSAGDGGDQVAGNGVCATAPPTPVCTLRAAIEEANALAGADVIQFNISPAGLQTISPGSGYPTITTVVTIDGTTQPGYAGTPIIEINGAGAGGQNAFTLSGAGSSGSKIQGLVIDQFGTGLAIRILNSSNNVIVGNYIGTDPTGTVARANGVGVYLQNGSNNQIGGTLVGEPNVISGNSPDGIQITGASATGNVIQGNYIGVDATGATGLGNAGQGIAIFGGASNNTVGGTAAAARNIISGNSNFGIGIAQAGTSGNLVQGNFIGTNAAGTASIPNLHGVVLQSSASGNTIGGALAGAGNVISGNNSNGIIISNSSNNTVQRNLIGTDASGTADLGNNQHGVQVLLGATNNLIGGASGNGNVISGNNLNGVDILQAGTSGNRVAGNIIGLDSTGGSNLANSAFGVAIAQGATGNIIGESGGGNVISGNGQAGVRIVDTGTNNNLVQLNYIGLDVTGTLARPNSAEGVILDAGGAAAGNTIGGVGLGNVISGNAGAGVRILNQMTGTTVTANIIGRNAADTANVANGAGGVRIEGSSGNTIGGAGAGAGNIIAGNSGGDGVAVVGTASGNAILQNSIFANAGLGIDLGDDGVTANDLGDVDAGPNNLQNFPVLSAVVTNGARVHIAGSLSTTAGVATYRVEFFTHGVASADPTGFGEGRTYLGFQNVTTDAAGNAVIGVTLAAAVAASTDYVTATATDPSNNTSELSKDVTAVGDLVVTTTADVVDGNTTSVSALISNNGPDGRISLREAILATNVTAGLDTIRFGIPLTDAGHFYYQDDSTPSSLSSVVATPLADADITDFDPDYPGTSFSWFTIQPGSALQDVSDPVVLDATTQPGFAGSPVIELNGISIAGSPSGLTLAAGSSGSTIRGFAISRFGFAEIHITGSSNNLVAGNFLGTDPTGSVVRGGHAGINVQLSSANNTIGGTTAADRNVVSGNTTDGVQIQDAGTQNNVVQGNYIGVDVTGTIDLGNLNKGVGLWGGAASNTIGGTGAGAGNVISGNDTDGINIANSGTDNTVIQGNYIGVDATGAVALPNAVDGISINAGSFNVIGGTAPGEGNVISGNGDDGLSLGAGSTGSVVQGNFIGTDLTGTVALGNTIHGVSLADVANNTIGGTSAGAGNVIANNGVRGIRTGATTLSGNSFLGNSIHSNGNLGIDLSADGPTANDAGDVDSGPNDFLNFPWITSVQDSGGTLTAYFKLDLPAGSYRIEFFKNPSGADPSGYGEGEIFVASTKVTHPGTGELNFTHNFAGTVGDVITATTTFCTDGSTCAAFGSTSEFSNAFTAVTTAVELLSFTAVARDAAVDLSWQTASELNNLGFHLYRADSEAGPYQRITATPIPGLGSSPTGAKYDYRDQGLTNGRTYYYKLEDIDTVGRTELHGPVSATPKAGTKDSTDDVTEDSRITVGDPSASSLQVMNRSRDGVVLELTTGGFYAEPQEDGSVRLSIPGLEALTETDAPGIPVKRTWVEALAGRRVKLLSVMAREIEEFTEFRPSDAETPEIVVHRDGTARAVRSPGRRSRAVLQRQGLYPSETARIVTVGFQGEVKKALVELAPLRWDGPTGRLLLAHRLVVRLSFRGREPAEETTDGVHGRRRRRFSSPSGDVVVRLATRDRGLYRVSFEELFGRRHRSLSASELRLSRQGEAVAHHIEPTSDRFGPGSTLYFVSDGASANPYGNEAVYELELAPGGETMERVDASPAGEILPYTWHTLRLEENRYYQAALLDAPDLWLWDLIMAPASKTFPFRVEGLASPTAPPHLRVWLQGASDVPGSPDHHVRIYVNHVFAQELTWDGKQAREIDRDLPPGALLEGDNELEIENLGDTGAAYSMVMLDRFEVVYPRFSSATGGKLEGSWSEPGIAELSGLGTAPLLLDTTDGHPRWLDGVKIGADGIVRARVEAGRRYLAVSREAILKPELRAVSSTGLASDRNGADYLVITPRAFVPAVAPLLELRRSQGLRVKVVPMEDVYSEFGFGEARPEALKVFLSYAYQIWQIPSPRYVVLVGDATYDFKDYLQTGVGNRVPPLMIRTSYLWTASDPSYAAVNGDDILPDFAIGRLPAASLDEARSMVAKIVAYENGDAGLKSAPAVFVTDNPDGAGNFVADADALASSTFDGREVRKIYLSELGVTATRNSILQAFDDGASILSYVGHGGIHLWASEDLFDISRVDSLSPQLQQPIVLTMNCLNGYFDFPYFDSLAEALLKAPDKGAVAAFSPSGLSLDGPAHAYHQALLEELVHGGHQRLGDAVMAAQADYAATGAFPELLSIYHLLGDPALELR